MVCASCESLELSMRHVSNRFCNGISKRATPIITFFCKPYAPARRSDSNTSTAVAAILEAGGAANNPDDGGRDANGHEDVCGVGQAHGPLPLRVPGREELDAVGSDQAGVVEGVATEDRVVPGPRRDDGPQGADGGHRGAEEEAVLEEVLDEHVQVGDHEDEGREVEEPAVVVFGRLLR